MISHEHALVFVHVPRTGGTSIERAFGAEEYEGKHRTARELRDALGTSRWNRYFKFSVVRNPWARAVSYYRWRGQRGKEALGRSFDQWIELVLRPDFTPDPGGDRRPQVALSDFRRAVGTQLDMVADADGTLLVDAIVRFERLQTEFDAICGRAGLEQRELPQVNQLSYDREDYRRFYGPRSAHLVADHYRRDIDSFGYRFSTSE